MSRTLEYLNTSMPHASFYAVEMVRFAGELASAFESRTFYRPPARERRNGQVIDLERFLGAIPTGEYRDALAGFLDFCTGQGLIVYFGSTGLSIRVDFGIGDPVSIGWLFPTGQSGWMGLSDATFGFDRSSLKGRLHLAQSLESYAEALSQIHGAQPGAKRDLSARNFAPSAFTQSVSDINAAIIQLVEGVSLGDLS